MKSRHLSLGRGKGWSWAPKKNRICSLIAAAAAKAAGFVSVRIDASDLGKGGEQGSQSEYVPS